MACFHPIKGYRAPGGEIKFARPGAFVDLPVTISCDQCYGCRLERSRQWAVRIMHHAQIEEQQGNESCFITLTYDDEHLPEDGSLDVTHWQSFAKSLRKRIGPFKFFHCGEYGDANYRPHYHAALFKTDFRFDREQVSTSESGHPLYTSPTLEKAWGRGHHWVGSLSYQSAAYVARYIMKKRTGIDADSHYLDPKTGVILKSEYTTMSRNPGLGSSWIEKYVHDVYPRDQVICNGKPARPPKYYDNYLEKFDFEMYTRVKAKRARMGSKHEENNTPDRLAVREGITERKLKQLKRNI